MNILSLLEYHVPDNVHNASQICNFHYTSIRHMYKMQQTTANSEPWPKRSQTEAFFVLCLILKWKKKCFIWQQSLHKMQQIA